MLLRVIIYFSFIKTDNISYSKNIFTNVIIEFMSLRTIRLFC